MKTTEFDETAAAYRNAAFRRSKLYSFLSLAFRYPTEEVVTELKSGKSLSVLDELKEMYFVTNALSGAIDAFKREVTALRDILGLQVEYTRLFIGPFRLPAPPYESVYRQESKGRLMGESTLAVKQMYQGEMLTMGSAVHDLPDHIIAETEFMSHLAVRDALTWDEANERTALLIDKQDAFLTEHLTQWIPKFSEAVCEHSREPLYAHLVKLTVSLISLDRDYVRAVKTFLKSGDAGYVGTSL